MTFDWRSLPKETDRLRKALPKVYEVRQSNFDELTRDPDRGGKTTTNGILEAVAISEASWARMIGPGIKRAGTLGDFVDATGRIYDVKHQRVEGHNTVSRAVVDFIDSVQEKHDRFVHFEAANDFATNGFAVSHPDRPLLMTGASRDPVWLTQPKEGAVLAEIGSITVSSALAVPTASLPRPAERVPTPAKLMPPKPTMPRAGRRR